VINYFIVFIFGAVIGSFLNVCIYRIPRNISLVVPSSRCVSCNLSIKPWDNIPILSYVFLGGKCRNCKEKISIRYPIVEALNAFFYIFVSWRYGLGWDFIIFCMICSSLIVIAFIDIDFQIIPDRITLVGIPIGLIAGSFILHDPFMRMSQLGYVASIIGFFTGGGLFYLIAVLSKGGMGGGDIKMMAMIGAFMGWKSVLLTTFLGSLTGSFLGIFLILFKGKGRKAKIPFGPFLAFGAIITIFYGQELLDWYLH
jgi:leader peptidase (prepilin peptidase)/N-methyltransferase